MSIKSTCSGCGKTLAVPDEFAGQLARCPSCGEVYTVPAIQSSAGPVLNPFDSPLPSASSNSAASGPAFGTANSHAFAPTVEPISSSGVSDPVSYWMKAPNGQQYGPVGFDELSRWYEEGRVGRDYLIATSSDGPWVGAADFKGRPATPTVMVLDNANPYAATPGMGYATASWQKSDTSVAVLVLGILTWFIGCPLLGIVGWIMGSQAIRDMKEGRMNPSNIVVARVGYYLSMAQILILLLIVGIAVLLGIAGNL